jgi:hypothetical protein
VVAGLERRNTEPTAWATIYKVAIKSLCTLCLMILITWPSRDVYLLGWNDFLSFYAGGRLAFTDRLYDPAVVSAIQFEASGTSGPALRFIRLPHYAIVLWPLSQLPYTSAYLLWQALNIGAVLTAIRLWPYSKRTLAHTFAVWLPLYWAFINGQDLGLMLCLIVAVIRQLECGNERKAASIVTACLIKFQFLWLVPVALIRHCRTLPISAGITAFLLLCPFAFNPRWPLEYYNAVVLSRSIISNTPCNLFPILGWPGLLLGVVVAAVLAWRCSPVIAFAGSIAIAVLVSPHAYIQDYALIAPLVGLLSERIRATYTSETKSLERQQIVLTRKTAT